MKSSTFAAISFGAVISLLASTARSVSAEQAVAPRILTPPAGWVADDAHAQLVERGLHLELPERTPGTVEVHSYRPSEGGGQLIASLLTVQLGGDAAGAWVRERIDAIHDTPAMMGEDGAKVRVISSSEKSDEANLELANDELGTVVLVRAVWVKRAHPEGTPDAIEEFRGECVMSADAAATLRGPCAQALAQMQLPAASDRTPIATPARVGEAPDEGDDDAPPPLAAKATPEDVPTIHETPSTVGPVIVKNPPAKNGGRDMRPFYIAGGLLLVIALLLWSRKKRQELADSDEAEADAKAKGTPAEPDPDLPEPDADVNALADAAAPVAEPAEPVAPAKPAEKDDA